MNVAADIRAEQGTVAIARPFEGASILPLELRGLRFEAGGRVLIDNLDLRLEAGCRTVVMGPNGAGKSLLLRLCHGLLEPTAGEVRWNVAAGRALQRAQAMVFQRPVLLRRSVAANIDYALAAGGMARAARRDRVAAALEEAGLRHIAQSPARVLSGGEQQRLAIARAWALRPQVLFLDEPSSHLDPAATRAVERMLERIVAAGTKIILTTHDLGQARRLADEVLFLHRGRLLEHSPATTFFTRPASAEAKAFQAGELLL